MRRLLLPIAVSLMLCATGCDTSAGADQGDEGGASLDSRAAKSAAEPALAPFQVELIDLAFDTASAYPVNPHIKSRSRAQHAVVTACIELDQPRNAMAYAGRIDSWRRGAAYADLAAYWAKRDEPEKVRRCIRLAEQVEAYGQDWRRDRVRVKIAEAHAWLGRYEQAGTLETGVVESESGKVAAVRAGKASDEAFDEQLAALDELVSVGNYDLLKNGLQACAALFDRFYGDAERRDRVEQRMKSAWAKMPAFIRIDLLLEMSVSAVTHGDMDKALALVDDAQAIKDAAGWPTEYLVPLAARLAAARFRAGDTGRARADADAALVLFEKHGETIINMYRAGALRPVAEAYHAMGDDEAALRVYGLTVEQGMVNPYSRPRADDLTATCLSMAVNAVEPDAELWERLRGIHGALSDPW